MVLCSRLVSKRKQYTKRLRTKVQQRNEPVEMWWLCMRSIREAKKLAETLQRHCDVENITRLSRDDTNHAEIIERLPKADDWKECAEA